MPRRIAIAIGVVYVAAAVTLCAALHAFIWGAAYLLLNGVVLAALAFECGRYRPVVDRARGHWRLTGERFVDPSSGRAMEVRSNPMTGERDYVEAGDQTSVGKGYTRCEHA